MNARSLFRTPPPPVALEITSRHVAAVVLHGGGGSIRVAAYAVEPLPEGAVVPALNSPNLVHAREVEQAVRRTFERLGHRPRRVGLVIPDAAAKVSFVRFERIPARRSDLEEMVRFQVRKAAPFRIDDSQVAYCRGSRLSEGHEFVVVQARRDIVAEYELVCQAAGAAAGAVDLATLGVVNAVLAAGGVPDGDWLLIHVSADAASLVIMRGDAPVFFRHRGADGDGHLSDLVHQTAMYYQDRLGGRGFSRALVSGRLPESRSGAGRAALEARLRVPIDQIDPTRAVPLADRITPGWELVDALTPAIGLSLAMRMGT
ncbi:MAG: pilus assembly protein PilM [Acidobacteriota bacterium]